MVKLVLLYIASLKVRVSKNLLMASEDLLYKQRKLKTKPFGNIHTKINKTV